MTFPLPLTAANDDLQTHGAQPTCYRRAVVATLRCRHALASGWIGDRDAPIAALGDKSITGQLDGIMRYAIAGLRADGSWGVALREVGTLVDMSRARSRARPATPPDRSLRAYSVLQRAIALST